MLRIVAALIVWLSFSFLAVGTPAADPKPRPAKPPKPPVTCKATDDKGAVLATATAPTTSQCRKQVYDALMKATCDGKTASLKYLFIAKEGAAPTKAFLFCPNLERKVPTKATPGPCTPSTPGCAPPVPSVN